VGTVSAFSLGPGRTVLITPAPTRHDWHGKTAHYLEWDGESVVLHPSRERVPIDFSLIELSKDEIYSELLARGFQGTDQTFWDRLREIWQGRLERQIAGTPFDALLKTVFAKRAREYLVVLVRPSGFDTFLRLRNYVMQQGIDVGYEPVEQSFKIRISGNG
jgi:hypothetical protein